MKRLLLVAAGVLALASSLVHAAPTPERAHVRPYAQGLAAMADGDWAKAKAKMERARAIAPTVDPVVRLYGMNYASFTPSFQLGLIAFHQGDCAGAHAAWRDAESVRIAERDVKNRKARAAALERCGAAPASETTEMLASSDTTPSLRDTDGYALQPGDTVRQTIDRWCADAGLTLDWQARADFRIARAFAFPDGTTLEQAVNEVLAVLSEPDAILAAHRTADRLSVTD